VIVATAVLCRAGIGWEQAHAFLIDTCQAAMRQVAHDDGEGLTWLYQVQSQARTRLARSREDL
jgi:hypothetical protein